MPVGVGATVDYDLRDLDEGFADMLKAAKDLRPAFRKLAPDMKRDQLEHGRTQSGPDGKWQPLSKATRARRKKRKIFSARFIKSFTVEIARKEMAAIHKIPWAGAHQFGERVGRGVKLPARVFVYLGDKFIAKALPEMRDHVVTAFAKRGKGRSKR